MFMPSFSIPASMIGNSSNLQSSQGRHKRSLNQLDEETLPLVDPRTFNTSNLEVNADDHSPSNNLSQSAGPNGTNLMHV